jgi:hypothetical protein
MHREGRVVHEERTSRGRDEVVSRGEEGDRWEGGPVYANITGNPSAARPPSTVYEEVRSV